jgi:hypothetical protein
VDCRRRVDQHPAREPKPMPPCKGLKPCHRYRDFRQKNLSIARARAFTFARWQTSFGARMAHEKLRQMASVGRWSRLNNAATSLQPHYRAFNATTGHSVPVLGVGTLALAVVAACGFSLHATGVTERRFSRSVRKPDRESRHLHAGCRLGRIRTSPKLIPEEGSAPGFDIA